MSSFEKLKLLIWKNFLLQRRHKWQTAFEIASPVVFSLFLILIRCLVDPQSYPAASYQPFPPTYFNMTGRQFGNLTSAKREGTLAFSPENNLTRKATLDAMATVARDNLGLIALFFDSSMLPTPKGYKDSKEMEKALTQPNVMNHILVGIQYDDKMANATEWPDDIKFALRFPAVMRTPMVEHPLRASWRTNLLFPLFPQPGPRSPDDMYGGKTPGYSSEMFLAVQHAVSQEIIRQKSGRPVPTSIYLQRLPQLPYRVDDLLVAMERFISMIVMICFAYTFVNTVRVVTAEKEMQLKETMTIMGLPSWLHWLAWFIKQFSFLLISVICIVILFKIPFNSTKNGDGYAVLTFTPWSVLLFFLVLFVIASLAFCFMVSVFFTRANTAASFMGLVWFSTYAAYMLTQMLYEDISTSTKLLLSLISNTAMGYALQMLIMGEGTSKGLQWGDFFTPVAYHDDFTPGHVALLLLVDAVLYMLIAMYVEKIRPGLYGVPLPWYFPFTKSFWFPNRGKVAAITKEDGYDQEYKNSLLKVVHDEEPSGVPMGIKIENLTKVYKGRKKAVDNLNLRMYENEITVLLGHNGAGKTTTISMLTGIIPPTSGSATINGYDIVTETELARRSLGICPQHNVLFPDLTVAEHIVFYSRLKGVPSSKVKHEVDHFMKLLDLQEKRDVLSVHLSGGQKRRLSVGAAMCGSSRVVLLDEPTSGLDPAARRSLWDLLQKEKRGRTLILTTHFMDEADVLGDRIAIMSGGRLQCVGRPYFLKKHYGIGYKITIVKAEDCVVEDVTAFFGKYVPDVKENTNIGSELTYILPNEHVAAFPDMLRVFEEQRQTLKVASYGLSVTSLEEVFMKVGAEDQDVSVEMRQNHSHKQSENAVYPIDGHAANGELSEEPIEKVKGMKLLRNHIKAMFLKLSYNSMRNKLTALIQFITPIINISISVLIARSWRFMSELPPLELSLESGFRNTETLLSVVGNLTENSTETKMMTAYKDYFKVLRSGTTRLNDLGHMDLSKYYLKLSTADQARVRYETLVGATFEPGRVTAWFSNYGYHDAAMSLARVDDALLRTFVPAARLSVINHPLPYSIESLVRVLASGSTMGFQFAFNIGFCMSFVTAFLVLFAIKERVGGAKLLQRVAGVRPAVLWTTALLWDAFWLLLVYIGIVATLAFYQENTLSSVHDLGRVMLVLILFSLAMIPLHYLASFYFEAAATGFSKMCFINIFSGCMPFLITEVLRLPAVGNPFYAHIFDWVFSPLPIYCLSRSFRDMSMSSFSMLACDALCTQFTVANCTRHTLCDKFNLTVCCIDDDPYFQWSEPGIGRYLFMMTLVGVVAFTVLLLKEYEVFDKLMSSQRRQPPEHADEDDDVAAERQFVRELPRAELPRYSLIATDLSKYYGSFLAVDRLSFAVRAGECFGLLGINGAGKTSTFRMLTGDSRPSSGTACVHGYCVDSQLQQVHRLIGYCPQFDALLENLTARETLRIFCLLRGIPQSVGSARGVQLAEMLGFTRHYDKKVHECSGGTKRKISTALALLGDSPLIYLDEPTTGMDPASKRLVWASVSRAVRAGRSVVLTSHSMEECEALCSRLTIMVNGQFSCLGPPQHLKNKFSQGYTLIVKCKSGVDKDGKINQYIMEQFNDVKLIETYLGISTYYIVDTQLPWWKLFHLMEEARRLYPVEDYSVSQTSLEQVFLRFTRLQGNAE